MDLDDILRALADSVFAGTCVACVGAGVSASYNAAGEDFRGYPTAGQLLQLFKGHRAYLAASSNLGDAAFLIEHREGRVALEKLLIDIYGVPRRPTPAHRCLADLQLPAYISFNFDILLEKELRERNTNVLPIREDRDVCRIASRVVPVIKPHGCVELPRTMALARDQVYSFAERLPIINHFMLSLLANRNILFVGFSLSDQDLANLFLYLKKALGNNMPRSTAVIGVSGNTEAKEFWESNGVTLVQRDATVFLQELSARVHVLQYQLEEDIEPWLKNAFFRKLLEIRALPSETQVIEALLAEIKSRISGAQDAASLRVDIKDAVDLLLRYRRNFSAVKGVAEELDAMFGRDPTPHGLWSSFNRLSQQREVVGRLIEAKATSVLANARRVLVYSQSLRVLELLRAAPANVQQQITLLVGECRPKSPHPFRDAVSIARQLKRSQYSIQILADTPLLHQLQEGRVDLVLLGAHAVFRSSKTQELMYFVNTCGSGAIVELADARAIPVKVIFESMKLQHYENDNELDSISFEEEEYIAAEPTKELGRDELLAERVSILNIGYDLVKWRPCVSAITEGD